MLASMRKLNLLQLDTLVDITLRLQVQLSTHMGMTTPDLYEYENQKLGNEGCG